MSGRKLPIAYIFGKDQTLADQAKEGIKGHIQVTQIFKSSSPSNVRRLQNLLNDPSEPKPDYIFTGLGFTREEFATHHNVKGAEDVTWIYGNPSSWVEPAGRVGPPPQAEVVERMRRGLREYEKLENCGKGKVWTWWWTGENEVEEYKM